MNATDNIKEQTFWEHLDELRGCLIRIGAVVVIFGIAAFLFKDETFAIILAPKSDSFIIYKAFAFVSERLSLPGVAPEAFSVK